MDRSLAAPAGRAALAAALAAFLVPLGARAAAPAPARVQVVAREYSFALSRRVVRAGAAVVELVDFGQDPHDLRIRRIGSRRVYGTPIVQPGGHYDLSLQLLPGTYELWCSIANHRALGMQAELVVKPAG